MLQKVTILTKFKVLIQISFLRNIFTALLKEIMLHILYRYRHRYRPISKKKIISVFYRYRPIRKLYLSACIGIGQYEKKLMGCSLYLGITFLCLPKTIMQKRVTYPIFIMLVLVVFCPDFNKENWQQYWLRITIHY